MRDNKHCAICREYVPQDQRHVRVSAETVVEDRPEEEFYLLHLSCWDSLSAGWGQP